MPTHEKQDWVSVIEALPHLEGELKDRINEGTVVIGRGQPISNDHLAKAKQIRVVSRRKKAGEEPQHYPLDEPAHTITQVQHIMEEVA